MFPQLQKSWDERDSDSGFILQELEGFPYEKFQELKTIYQEAEAWFSGEKLGQTNKNNDELYPLKVNPIINTCLKHAYLLFGEPQDDGRPQVYPRIIPPTAADTEAAAHTEETLNRVWSQSGGRALLIEGGILSQIYGGTVLKVNWNGYDRDPSNDLNQVKIESLPATYFYGVPYPGDYYRLRKAWIIKKLEDTQAEALGHKPQEYEDNWFVEYWDESKYWQKINNKIITVGEGVKAKPMAGRNEWGFVPIVYVPHIRIGTFLGINTFNHLLGIVKEINLRYADYGDAVNDDSHSNLAGRNISGSPQMKKIGGGLQFIDLGSARNITGNEPDPDLFEVSKTNKASTAMKDLSDVLYDQYRRDAAHPSVADGEDEGSQRSGLTIAMRFWPMTSHIGTERYFWTPALNKINWMVLKILEQKKKGGITNQHIGFPIKQKWAPLLPRDREADVQEWAQRAANDIGSIDTLLDLTGDIENIDQEKKKILDWKKKITETEQQIIAKYAVKKTEAKPSGGGDKIQTKESKKKTETLDKTKPNSD